MKTTYGSYLQQRDNGRFYFLWTVPQSQRTRFGGKAQIRKSLKTRDRGVAMVRVGPLIQQYKTMCEPKEAAFTYDNAKESAALLGFDLITAENLQSMNLQESIAKMSPAIVARDLIARPTPIERIAFGGAVEVPALPASKLYERFKIADPGRVKNKTPEKARKAWKRYETKINQFVKMMGDQDCIKLTKKIVLEYRNALIERVHNEEFKSAAANEYLEKFRTAWRKVIAYEYEELNLPDPFDKVEGIDFKDGGKKEDFTEDEVVAIRHLLETSKTVNPELKALMLISQNTGIGADELVYMTPEDIVLDHEIPHLKIRPNANRKELKNGHRPRNMPLIGVALQQAKLFPNGFPRYCMPSGPTKVSEHSAVIIKKVAKDKSFGSYRHRIATLMRNNENIKDQFQDAIMGHGNSGKMTGYYGSKPWLEKLANALKSSLPEDA